MRNRVISAFLAVVMAVAMLPLVPVAAAGYSKSQVDSLMAEWNSGKYAQNKSTSYGGATECAAFTRFLFYELWGHYDREGETKNKLMPSGSDDIPCTTDTQLMNYLKTYAKPGDSFRLTSSTGTHIMHLYDIDTEGKLLFYESNFEGNSKNKARFMVSTLEDVLGDIATVKNDGSLNRTVYLTIIHASNNTATQFSCVCSHTYVFKNDNSVVCSKCKTAYTVPAPSGGGKYMDIVKVNSTGTAPSHTTPYGDATIGTRYKKGDTVYVVGSAQNAFQNKWYKLSTGEWVVSDYLGTHVHCWAGDGFCTRCVDGTLKVISIQSTQTAVKSGFADFPVRFAPYNDSIAHTYIRTKDTKTVTVNGKVINGYRNVWYRLSDGRWVFSDYLEAPSEESKQVEPTPSQPGSSGGSSSSSGGSSSAGPNQVYVYYPSDPTYLNKFAVSDTNATVVANILKPAGSKVTACGLLLYDTNANLIKDHRESISNVGDGQTSFHAWYDIQKDLGLTLTPGTRYLYKIYAVVDGVTYVEAQYSFTTTGSAPVVTPPAEDPKQEPEQKQDAVQYNLIFDPNGGSCDTQKKTIVFDTLIGEMPVPVRDGYTFDGWYGAAEGGNLIHENMRYNASFDVTVYAHWTAKTYNLIFNPNGGSCTTRSKAVTFDTLIGELPIPVRSGHTFDGWYTLAQDGKLVHEQMRYNAPYDVTIYAHWSEKGNAAAAMKDLAYDAWYFDAVNYVISNGLMGGYNATTFGPDDSLNRAMMLQILYNKEGQPAVSGTHGFTDAPASQWYNNAIIWGTRKGIMGGYGGGKFGPDDAVTIEQIAVILWNYSGNPFFNGNANTVGAHSSWAANALGWAVENGILDKLPNKTVTSPATRAEAAQMLANLITKSR